MGGVFTTADSRAAELEREVVRLRALILAVRDVRPCAGGTMVSYHVTSALVDEAIALAAAQADASPSNLVLAAWRVIGWLRRVNAGYHPAEPGLTALLSSLEDAAGPCPADIAIRADASPEGEP
jgi:hypothetical protein